MALINKCLKNNIKKVNTRTAIFSLNKIKIRSKRSQNTGNWNRESKFAQLEGWYCYDFLFISLLLEFSNLVAYWDRG